MNDALASYIRYGMMKKTPKRKDSDSYLKIENNFLLMKQKNGKLVRPSHFGKSQCGVGLSSVPISTIGYEKRFNRSVEALLDKQKFIDYMKNQKTMEIPEHIKIKDLNKGNN